MTSEFAITTMFAAATIRPSDPPPPPQPEEDDDAPTQPFRREAAPAIVNECPLCGARHSAEDWKELPYVGAQVYFGAVWEQRNCRCGSTRAVMVSEAPTDYNRLRKTLPPPPGEP